MPIAETFRFVVEAVTDKAQGALDGLERKAGTAASALRDKLTDGANKAVGAITGRVPDASRALDKLEGSAKDAGAALDKAAGEAKAFDGASYRADLKLDGGQFEQTAHDLQDDIHKIVEEADRKVELQIDAGHAKQELREVGDAAEHAGRQEFGSVDSLRDVSGALGDVGGTGLDAADGILGFAEAMAMTVPGAQGLLSVLGPAGFAVGALAVGAGLLGKVLGGDSAAAAQLKKDTDDLAKAFAGLRTADPAERLGALRDKLNEVLQASPDLARYIDELGVSGRDLAVAMQGGTAPAIERVRTELGSLRGEVDAATGAVQQQGAEQGRAVGRYEAEQTALENVAKAHGLTRQELVNRLKVEGEVVGKVDELTGATKGATDQDNIRREVLQGITDDMARQEAAADSLRAAVDEHKAAVEAETTALLNQNTAMQGLTDSRFNANRAARDAEQALEDLGGALDAIAKSDDSAETKQRKVNAAYDEAAQKVIAAADAAVHLADDTAKASGATLTQTQRLELQNRKYLEQASNLTGPVQQAVLQHIADVNGIPLEKVTEIVASTPNLAEQEAKINAASRNRTATITFDAQGLQAIMDQYQSLRNRSVTVDFQGRTHIEGTSGQAAGGYRAGLTLLGEDGPEIAELPIGTTVRTANESRRILAGALAGPSSSTTVHVYLPAGANGPDLVAALRRWERRNGNWRA